jgi:hypothetical protein
MALTNPTLPSIVPKFTLPRDAQTEFANAQTLTATGYINNTQAVIDLGGGSGGTAGVGRILGFLALDITAIDVSSGDETYGVGLIGSNDVAFGNGNCDLLMWHDFTAAASARTVPTICAASPAIPPTGITGTLMALPFTNLMQGFIYRYMKLRAIIGGTTPTITLSAWLSPLEGAR